MTDEDQQLVARAALHGARFCRVRSLGAPWQRGKLWSIDNDPNAIARWSIGRAAEAYLWKNGMRTDDEHYEYNARTDYSEVQELDVEWAERLLAAQGEESNG